MDHYDLRDDLPVRSHFPLFVDIRGKEAVMVGGGPIAARRLKALCSFAFRIRAVAPAFLPEIEAMADKGLITLEHRPFQASDVEGAFLVVAATGHRTVNCQIGRLAKEAGAFVSVADCKEESSFYFPGLAFGESLTAAVTGNGNNHPAVKAAAARIREILTTNTESREDKSHDPKS